MKILNTCEMEYSFILTHFHFFLNNVIYEGYICKYRESSKDRLVKIKIVKYMPQHAPYNCYIILYRNISISLCIIYLLFRLAGNTT